MINIKYILTLALLITPGLVICHNHVENNAERIKATIQAEQASYTEHDLPNAREYIKQNSIDPVRGQFRKASARSFILENLADPRKHHDMRHRADEWIEDVHKKHAGKELEEHAKQAFEVKEEVKHKLQEGRIEDAQKAILKYPNRAPEHHASEVERHLLRKLAECIGMDKDKASEDILGHINKHVCKDKSAEHHLLACVSSYLLASAFFKP